MSSRVESHTHTHTHTPSVTSSYTHLVVTPLGWHDDAADLLDLRVVRGADTVHEARDLGAQVCYADELLQQVLGHHKPVCVRARKAYLLAALFAFLSTCRPIC